MRRLIEKDGFWWVSSVAIAGVASYATIFLLQVAEFLYQKYSGLVFHSVFQLFPHLPLGVGVAMAFSTMYFSWRLIYKSSSPISVKSSIRASVLSVLLAHFLFFINQFVFNLLTRPDLVKYIDIELTIMVSGPFFSLIWFGWLTLPLGAIFGGLIGWLYDRTHPASDNQNASPKTDPTSAT